MIRFTTRLILVIALLTGIATIALAADSIRAGNADIVIAMYRAAPPDFPLREDAPDEYRLHITLGPDL